MNELWARIRTRKLFQWAAAYLAAACDEAGDHRDTRSVQVRRVGVPNAIPRPGIS